MRFRLAVVFPAVVLLAVGAVADAADQAAVGAGNQAALAIAEKSPMVRSAFEFLNSRARAIHNTSIRNATLDAIANAQTCVAHRRGLTAARKASIVQQLIAQGLLDASDAATIPGGVTAGVFPAVLDDGGACPHLPQQFLSAPGSAFGSHHSYPGGLSIHEAFNELTGREIAADYRAAYGCRDRRGLPIMDPAAVAHPTPAASDIQLDEDLVIAAPIWHDWAKTIVYQWNADGTEFKELPLGGNGKTDKYGAAGDSRTGAHHILGLAETIARRLPPELIVAQASAHSAPTMGNEYKVVNWIRTAALIAGVDPIGAGYLRTNSAGELRLPAFRGSRSFEMPSGDHPQPYFLAEDIIHNLSDANFTYSMPSVSVAEAVLRKLAPDFGYDPAIVAEYNSGFRNPVLSCLSAERVMFLLNDSGTEGVAAAIRPLVDSGLVHRGRSASAR